VTRRPPAATPPEKLARYLLSLGVVTSLALAAVELPPRAAYLARLAAASGVRERGVLAASEFESPLVPAGQADWRRRLARRTREGARDVSGHALVWSFFVEARHRLPQGARVLLATPHAGTYFTGNFLIHPVRVEVAPHVGTPIAGSDDLRRASLGLDCEQVDAWLALGYDGCVALENGEPYLMTPEPRP
jgi:hypothetical protein